MERLRAYSREQLTLLKSYLRSAGIEAIGGDNDHGAFLAVRLDDPAGISSKLAERGLITDARGPWLRLCPDCLTTDRELRIATSTLAEVLQQTQS